MPHARGPAAPARLGAVLLAVAALTAAAPAADAAAARARVTERFLLSASVPQLERALADRRLTATRLTRFSVSRIRRLDRRGPRLNAVMRLDRRALATARRADARLRRGRARPMEGIPVLLKGNIDVRGHPTTAGSLALRDAYPRRDAALVRRLRASGAIVLGIANMTEFAGFMSTAMPPGYSAVGGFVRNVHDPRRDPCGSSTGSAVAVAAHMAAVSFGTETSGSLLCPADAAGVVSVKPSLGLVPTRGILPLTRARDVAGPMSRHVEDAALALGMASGRGHAYLRAARAGSLRGARFGWLQDYDELLEPSQRAAAESALAVLRRAGATVEPIAVPRVFTLPAQYPGELFTLLYEFKRDLEAYLATSRRASVRTMADLVRFNRAHPRGELRFGQNLLEMAAAIDPRRDAARYAAQASRPAEVHRGVLEAALRQGPFDALLFAGPDGPPLVDPPGYPAVMVPAGGRGGPPVGLAFAGRPRTEARLLGYARAFERARG